MMKLFGLLVAIVAVIVLNSGADATLRGLAGQDAGEVIDIQTEDTDIRVYQTKEGNEVIQVSSLHKTQDGAFIGGVIEGKGAGFCTNKVDDCDDCDCDNCDCEEIDDGLCCRVKDDDDDSGD